MSETVESVTFNIRACIMSSQGPFPVWNLMRDYETLTGTSIPYRRLGHPTLESFLQSIPSLRITGSGRDLMVQAATSQSSKHVTSLIAKQKPARRNTSGPSRRGSRPSSSYGRARGCTPRNYVPRDSYNAPREINNALRESNNAPRESNNAPRRYPTNNYPSQPEDYRKDQVEDREDHLESLVVRIEGNDRRQVQWNPTSRGITITFKTNQDSYSSSVPFKLDRYRSHYYY